MWHSAAAAAAAAASSRALRSASAASAPHLPPPVHAVRRLDYGLKYHSLPSLCSDRGVFNIEGGCYAKAIGLKEVRRGSWLGQLAVEGASWLALESTGACQFAILPLLLRMCTGALVPTHSLDLPSRRRTSPTFSTPSSSAASWRTLCSTRR